MATMLDVLLDIYVRLMQSSKNVWFFYDDLETALKKWLTPAGHRPNLLASINVCVSEKTQQHFFSFHETTSTFLLLFM